MRGELIIIRFPAAHPANEAIDGSVSPLPGYMANATLASWRREDYPLIRLGFVWTTSLGMEKYELGKQYSKSENQTSSVFLAIENLAFRAV